jgi:hypothetical protein
VRAVAQELQAIEAKQGHLVPVSAVGEVKNNPKLYPTLHGHLIWDDKVAGARHRIEQMRELIRSVRIEVLNDEPLGARTVRQYVSVGDSSGRAYHRIDEVMGREELRTQAFGQWEKEVAALRARNRVMSAFYSEWIAAENARLGVAS